MAHYAFVNEENIVVEVITGKDEDDLDSLPEGYESWERYYETKRDGLICKRTSYNTTANQHTLDGTPYRGNYAGIGMVYDSENDVFYAEQPYPSWTISSDTNWIWQPPIEQPTLTEEQITAGAYYEWNEADQTWDLVE